MSQILHLNEDIHFDESISKIDYLTFHPFSATYRNGEEIRFIINNLDILTLPHEAKLYIEFSLTGNDGEAVPADTAVLINNYPAFFFESIRFEINNRVVDSMKNVGECSTIKNLLCRTPQESNYLTACGFGSFDGYNGTQKDYNCFLPLKNLLGFCEDYKKVLVGCRQELVLIRNRNDDDIVKLAANNSVCNVSIKKIELKMPHIQLSDSARLGLLKTVSTGRYIPLAYRSMEFYDNPSLSATNRHIWTLKSSAAVEKPRYIIFTLQTNKRSNKTAFTDRFDHCSLTDFKLYLNKEYYPYDSLNLDFGANKYVALYDLYAKFQESYYGKDRGEPYLTYEDFKNRPLVVIDCSRQQEIKTGTIDIRIEFQTSANIPANTNAICCIIHDNVLEYEPLTSNIRNKYL